jgi:type IV pilus assembly protein PilY1
VTFGVAFGVTGTLDPFDTKTPGDLTDTDPEDPGFSWPTVSSNTDTTIDDLWHAAYNGRGQFLSAKNPAELAKRLKDAFKSIADRTASSSSVALSSGFLNSGSLLFQARFDSTDWSGQLLAYSIVSSGTNIGDLGTRPEWDAGCVLTGGGCLTPTRRTVYPGQNWNTGREILTYKPSTETGIPFRWPADPASPATDELDVEQTTWLRTDPVTGLDDGDNATAEDRLEFLRGRAVSGMRDRSSVLGDIANSNPVYVAAPAFAYPDSLETPNYSDFVAAKSSRTPMIYVGANDGMLHGFEATSLTTGGTERIAYVPSEVYENLSMLTAEDYGSDPNLEHRTFVDASATAADVVWGGSWKTVLVGGLGKGGQGIYALNVTDPSSFDESSASSLVMWEFTDADDSDLGFTYGQPAVVKMQDGKWYAIVGNGYNNTDNRGGLDSHVSTTGNAVLYIIDISNGNLVKKLDTGKGAADDPTGSSRPNGLATPSPVDLDGDRRVDYIYVPDLFGNVWKIDVRSSTPANWNFAFNSSGPAPFFVTNNGSGTGTDQNIAQPITTRVDVGLHPTQAGQMIYFGTGKYIEVGDNNPNFQQTQTFYAIWDRNTNSSNSSGVVQPVSPEGIARNHLLEQVITEEAFETFSDAETSTSQLAEIRITTEYPIQWHEGSGLPTTSTHKLGWYMDLYNTQAGNTDNGGEKMVSDPVLRDGKIIFVTLEPLEDPCDFGGGSWLMEVDATSGARLFISPFDLNHDGVFDYEDFTQIAGGGAIVSGVRSGVGILPSPGILKDNSYSDKGVGREFKYFSGSSGSVQKVTESRGSDSVGRQSWREIYEN